MSATKQLILRLPPDIHKDLKMISVAVGKTMTELAVEWIMKMKCEIFSSEKEDPVIKAFLKAPVNNNKPDRWSKKELEEMCNNDDLSAEEDTEIDKAIHKRKLKK